VRERVLFALKQFVPEMVPWQATHEAPAQKAQETRRITGGN
jgi:hypothetical protein